MSTIFQDMDNEGGASYNIRAFEIECSNLNKMGLTEWYALPLTDRELKVACMVMPNLFGRLQAMQAAVNAKLAQARAQAAANKG